MKKIFTASIIILLLNLVSIIFPNNIVEAATPTIYVDDSNTDGPWDGTLEHPYQIIQNGIIAASENQTIYVLGGTYNEELLIDKAVELIAFNKGKAVIDGNGAENIIEILADYVTIQDFTIKNGTYGIRISSSSNNTIRQNTIMETNYGAYIDSSSNNKVYHNNFLNNIHQAYDDENNTWDNGHSSGGNYWDDYTSIDSNDDGIGDASYDIPGGDNQDMYPFVNPINEIPVTNFTYSPINPTTQETVNFTDESVDPDGYILTWFWNFGDGNTSSEQNPSHKYADDGLYNVTLKATDDVGQFANKSYKITVLNVEPTAEFNYHPANPTDIEYISFSDASIDLDGNISSWSWNFGDMNFSNQANPQHNYHDDGVYTVILTVTDDDGATATFQEQITVLNVAPSADFGYTPRKPTTNDTLQFQDKSNDPDGAIISWSWNLGDGTTSSERSPSNQYDHGGSYTITLTIIDDDGESSTVTKKIHISEEAELSEDYTGWIIVFAVFMAIFIVMIVVVFRLTKKYK
jgi:parallel beta-helix repeat protein